MEKSALQKLKAYSQQQQTIGISLCNFKQKFAFNQNSGTNPEALHLDINDPLPSQKQGLTLKEDNLCTYLMTQIIFKAGQMLKLPVSTSIVAVNIAQYFYTRKSYIQFDFRQISMGAMFLACKSEETLRKTYQISSTFDYLFKTYQGLRDIRPVQLNSPEFIFLKAKVLSAENQILFELGFQIYKLFDIPHRYISGLLASFNRHKLNNQIAQASWCFLNDIYRTRASIYYPGQLIATASIFMALKKLQIPFPEKPWWILMESSFEFIQNIISMTETFYNFQKTQSIDFTTVQKILEQRGFKHFQFVNVFPVPYYRKINLDNKGRYKFRQNKAQLNPIRQKAVNLKQERNRSRQKQAYQSKKSGKYVNDDETPKLKDRNKTKQIKNQSQQIKQNGINQSSQAIQQKNQVKQNMATSSKSVLSKISERLKKIQVMKDVNISLNQVSTQKMDLQNQDKKISQSSSDDQDQLLADLIKIKKKNLQKKQE